jgi:protein involved in polysaccharide export with SLBB domain
MVSATNDDCIHRSASEPSRGVSSLDAADPAQEETGSARGENGYARGENSVRGTALPSSQEGFKQAFDRESAGDVHYRRELPAPPEPLTEFQQFVASATGLQLPIYGANLFREVPTTFAPNELAPVSSDYVLGPGDELRIRIWGQITYSDNLRIDRSGNIYLPLAGTVHVAGLKYAEVDPHLRAAVGRMYRNFDLSVDIGRIRSIQIYVTGQTRRPGMFTVSSLSTLVDALFTSGGPSLQGSFRHIQLIRDGKTMGEFDLYALLSRGDKSKDMGLLPEDIIHIPSAGPQVAILGSIRSAGIYELRGDETIGELLALAGKTTVLSSNTQISLERVGQDQRRQALEFALDGSGQSAKLSDGDILKVFQILPAYKKTVTLRGALANPGHFAWHAEMRLSDVIPDRDSLMSRDYWVRRNQILFTPTVVSTTATSQLQSASHAAIATQTTQSQLTRQSDPEIDWKYASIERIDPDTLKSSLISFDLGKLVLDHDIAEDLPLQPGDTITIYSQGEIRVPLDQQTKYVDLEGEVVNAGIYSVHEGETLRDIVQRAGGITKKAYLYGAEFSRESTRLLQQARIDEYVRSIELEMRQASMSLANYSASAPVGGTLNAAGINSAQDSLMNSLSQVRASGRIVLEIPPNGTNMKDIPAIDLENGDRLIVPPIPKTVNVVGAVYNQNSFIYRSTIPVGRYLQLAGGLDRNADGRRAYVIRADGSVMNRGAAKGNWGNAFNKLRLNPGDTIVVPNKNLRPNTTLKSIMDWSQSFSQLAIGSAAVSILK